MSATTRHAPVRLPGYVTTANGGDRDRACMLGVPPITPVTKDFEHLPWP